MTATTKPAAKPAIGIAKAGRDLKLHGIAKSYGDFVALHPLNLSVDAGEFVSLLGPSGSGKTTLLNIVAGFLNPDGGDILVGGKPILDLPPHRRGLGVVFQNYSLFPHMSVSRNVAFPLQMRRTPKAEAQRAVDDALQLVGMKDFADRFPAQLSGGQQQRVAVARAIVFRPSILLMDEPFGALDRKLRERLQVEIRRLQRQLGLTIIFVTHDQEEAMSMSDRIVLMDHGRIVQVGTAREVYENPNSHFSASFMGENNLFEATVVRRHGDLLSVSSGGMEFSGTSEANFAPGSTLRASIRAERIRLGRPGHFELQAAVLETTYVGSTERLVLRLDNGLEIVARTSSIASSLSEGDRVSVFWDPADLRLIE